MLHKNRRVLEKIVEELLEFEILTAKVKKSWFWIGTSLNLTGTFTCPLLSSNFNLHLSMLIDLVVWYRQTTNDIYLLFNIEIHSSWYWQDLQRIFEDNGGVREKEPFFLSGSHDREVFYLLVLSSYMLLLVPKFEFPFFLLYEVLSVNFVVRSGPTIIN